ncbi:MAG: hypothetical protein HY908_26725 [Myxococcales bacterium]|nr:hypothetical protein [Myxococcales bacterium]
MRLLPRVPLVLAAALLAAAALAGCDKALPSLADLEKLKADACACHDADCKPRVLKLHKKLLSGAPLQDADVDTRRLVRDIAECLPDRVDE